jgi:hypothetical protein
MASAVVHVPAVSKWSVGMHVHHCCLAMIRMCQALEASTPPIPPSKSSMRAKAIFFIGRIPRGRGKSPEAALPTDISAEELESLLDRAERMVLEAQDLDPKCWFKHFAFGVLDRDKTLRFIRIHNRHHLRIIRDITSH